MAEPVALPEWVALLVGRLSLEVEAMRQHIAAIQARLDQLEPQPDPPDPL